MENEILQQILSELKDLKQGQTELQQGQSETNKRLDTLEQGQSETNKRLDTLEQGQKRIEIIIENEVKPNIKLVAEQHGTIIEKLDGLPEKIRALQDDTTVHKAAIKELSRRTANL